MASTGVVPILLLLSFGSIGLINGAICDSSVLQNKLVTCTELAYTVINSTQCLNLETPIRYVFTCFKGCDDPPNYMKDELTLIKQAMVDAIKVRCYDNRPAEARDGDAPAAACSLQEGLECITAIPQLINIPNVNLNNLNGICSLVRTISGFIKDCSSIVTGCIQLFAQLDFNLNEIQGYVDMADELASGGCDCAAEIEQTVQRFTAMDGTPCGIIVPASRTLRGIMDNCVQKLVTAARAPSIDWLDVVVQALNIIDPLILTACGTFTILSGSASKIGLSLLAASAIIVIHLLRT